MHVCHSTQLSYNILCFLCVRVSYCVFKWKAQEHRAAYLFFHHVAAAQCACLIVLAKGACYTAITTQSHVVKLKMCTSLA